MTIGAIREVQANRRVYDDSEPVSATSTKQSTAAQQCPECSRSGRGVQLLRFFHISLQEAVEKCSSAGCMYPFRGFRYRDTSGREPRLYRYERQPAPPPPQPPVVAAAEELRSEQPIVVLDSVPKSIETDVDVDEACPELPADADDGDDAVPSSAGSAGVPVEQQEPPQLPQKSEDELMRSDIVDSEIELLNESVVIDAKQPELPELSMDEEHSVIVDSEIEQEQVQEQPHLPQFSSEHLKPPLIVDSETELLKSVGVEETAFELPRTEDRADAMLVLPQQFFEEESEQPVIVDSEIEPLKSVVIDVEQPQLPQFSEEESEHPVIIDSGFKLLKSVTIDENVEKTALELPKTEIIDDTQPSSAAGSAEMVFDQQLPDFSMSWLDELADQAAADNDVSAFSVDFGLADGECQVGGISPTDDDDDVSDTFIDSILNDFCQQPDDDAMRGMFDELGQLGQLEEEEDLTISSIVDLRAAETPPHPFDAGPILDLRADDLTCDGSSIRPAAQPLLKPAGPPRLTKCFQNLQQQPTQQQTTQIKREQRPRLKRQTVSRISAIARPTAASQSPTPTHAIGQPDQQLQQLKARAHLDPLALLQSLGELDATALQLLSKQFSGSVATTTTATKPKVRRPQPAAKQIPKPRRDSNDSVSSVCSASSSMSGASQQFRINYVRKRPATAPEMPLPMPVKLEKTDLNLAVQHKQPATTPEMPLPKPVKLEKAAEPKAAVQHKRPSTAPKVDSKHAVLVKEEKCDRQLNSIQLAGTAGGIVEPPLMPAFNFVVNVLPVDGCGGFQYEVTSSPASDTTTLFDNGEISAGPSRTNTASISSNDVNCQAFDKTANAGDRERTEKKPLIDCSTIDVPVAAIKLESEPIVTLAAASKLKRKSSSKKRPPAKKQTPEIRRSRSPIATETVVAVHQPADDRPVAAIKLESEPIDTSASAPSPKKRGLSTKKQTPEIASESVAAKMEAGAVLPTADDVPLAAIKLESEPIVTLAAAAEPSKRKPAPKKRAPTKKQTPEIRRSSRKRRHDSTSSVSSVGSAEVSSQQVASSFVESSPKIRLNPSSVGSASSSEPEEFLGFTRTEEVHSRSRLRQSSRLTAKRAGRGRK